MNKLKTFSHTKFRYLQGLDGLNRPGNLKIDVFEQYLDFSRNHIFKSAFQFRLPFASVFELKLFNNVETVMQKKSFFNSPAFNGLVGGMLFGKTGAIVGGMQGLQASSTTRIEDWFVSITYLLTPSKTLILVLKADSMFYREDIARELYNYLNPLFNETSSPVPVSVSKQSTIEDSQLAKYLYAAIKLGCVELIMQDEEIPMVNVGQTWRPLNCPTIDGSTITMMISQALESSLILELHEKGIVHSDKVITFEGVVYAFKLTVEINDNVKCIRATKLSPSIKLNHA